MSVSITAGDLVNGRYFGRIQDALGNGGASITFSGNGLTSSTITGNPTGLPKSSGSQAASKGFATQPATILTLSPTAQAAASDASIALQLIQAAKSRQAGLGTSYSQPASPVDTKSGKPAYALPSTVEPSAPANESGSSNGSDAIKQIISSGQAALASPNIIYQLVAASPDFLKQQGISNPQERVALDKAFTDGTLSATYAANAPGVQTTGSVTVSGTSETESFAVQDSLASAPPANGNYELTLVFPGLGALSLTWPTIPA